MIVLSRWLIFIACLFVFFIQPCIALELIISDSGRNQSFSSKLNSGDNFSVIGSDGKPVGGTLAGTHFIEQFLVPMPSKIELEQMSASQEKIWTKNLGGMLKDRVHIAITNGAEVFEIRLLQDTPKPENSAMSWQESAHTDRFANMTYRAIGELVNDLKVQETQVRITAALADSGGSAFAMSVNAWEAYADTFRRVDFVDARAMHTDVRQVIKILGSKRVRIINTDGLAVAPSMTVARSEVTNNLLASNPDLSAYTLKLDLKEIGKPDTTPWMSSLAGYKSYSVERKQYVDNKVVNQQLSRIVTGQDFRAPKRGWDPVNNNMKPTELLDSLGILPSESCNKVVPNLRRSLATGYNLRPEDNRGSVSNLPAFFALADNTHDTTQLSMQMKQLVEVSTDFKNVYVVGETDSKLTRQLADSIAFKIGSDRVQLINPPDGIRRSQSLAKSSYDTCIVGWKQKFDTTYKNASFLVHRDVSDILVKGASTLQSSVKAMKSFYSPKAGEPISPFKAMLANKYSERLGEHKWLTPTFRTVKRATGLLESVNKDISRVNQGKYSWVTSHTVEKIGEIGFDVMTSTEFLDKAIRKTSVLYKPLQNVGRIGSAGGIDAIRAVSHMSGSGRWNPKEWDVKTWELVTDSFSDATAYGLGYTIAGHETGAAFQSSATLARAGLRTITKPWFDAALGARSGKASIAVAQYEDAVSRAVLSGAKIPSSEKWFSKDIRKSLNINNKDFNRIKKYEDNMITMQNNNQLRERQRGFTPKTSIISLSNPMSTNSKTKSEMKLLNSIINRQNNVTLQGNNPVFERVKYDHKGKVDSDSLGIKSGRGTTIRMKPSTPAYRTVFPILSKYEDAKYGNTVQSARSPRMGLSQYSSDNVKRKLPYYDIDRKLKPVDHHFGGGGPPPPPGGGGMRDITSRMFPISNALNTANMNKYLPISTMGQQKFGQPNVRGVLLKGAASLNEGAEAFGEGDVSLVFQDSAGEIDIYKLRCFVTSLWAAYLSVEGPGISIDPAEPKMDYQKVRHIGQVKNTYLTRVMRETDYLMKQWAIGTHRPDIKGFLTSDDFSELLKKEKGKKRVTGRPSRFWLVPDGLAFTRSGNMLLLSGGRMTVQTEYLDDNPKGEKNEANEAFAKWFTNDYSLISAHYPIFQELFDYAQLVSLGTYLRENRVPMLKFLLANRELIITEKSIDKVDKLKKKSDYEWNISISGGVALEATESVRDQRRYKTDESLKEAFNEADKESGGLDILSDTVVFNSGATDYTVTSNQSLMLSDSPATGDIVQTDFAHWKEYEEVAGEEKWSLVTPAMELIRYYNLNIKTRAQLGQGWHLLVPFRLENSKVRKPLVPGVLPARIAMVNLLSGEREIMKSTIDQKTNRINYIPLDKNAFVSLLVPLSNGSWALRDRLGATFRFDKEGDLTHMELRPEKTISFKVGDKAYRKKIPGYIAEYKYKTKVIAGRSQKLLISVRQGNEIARITRVVDNQLNHIASIQILHIGQGKPIEILTYMYNKDDRLVRVTNKNAHSTEIAYNDDEMQVVSIRK